MLENLSVYNVIIVVKLVQFQILHVQLVIHQVLELQIIKNVSAKMDILMMGLILSVRVQIFLILECHYSCFKCSSFSTKCDSCGLTSNREFNNLLFSCNCFNNYYDSGIEICQKCHYSCSTCNSFGSQSCKSCLDKTISFRVINGNICQCLFGYYDDGNSTNCKKCSIFCQTCQNAADYCTSCTSTRHLETNKCICDTGYFDQMLELCSKCDSNCVNCKLSPKNCIECDSTLLKVFDNKTQTCICMNGTTDINGVCQFCDITCLTCINTISNCSSCKALKLLINTKCQCIEGTYETGVDKECQLCNSTCQTCINKENYCTSCSTDKYRIFKTGNICICQDGYYEDLVTFVCKQCDFSCLTCQITSKNCQSCDSKMNLSLDLQNKCICSSGFFLNSTSRICEACNITCKECKNLTQCNECEPITRHLDSENLQCLCKDGYYEVNQRKCSLCNITCKTCINQATKCKTCEAIYYRILNNSNACICLDGYYDVGIEMCLLCNKLCKTCQISSTKCYSCYEIEQFRYLSSNQCICKSGYYDNGFPLCEKCSNSCLTCSGKKDYCTSCDINQNRVDLSAIKKCPCSTGFFSDENEVCQKCSLKCSSCSLYKDSCLSCSISKTSNRLSISKNCNCKEGYYDDDLQLDCQNCSVRCKLCSQSSTNCQICSINLRENPPVCNCKAGFYENQSFNCEVCENQCNTCEKTSSNCLTCKEGRYTQKCLCEDGYFEGGQPLCLQCSFQCKTCSLSSLNCLICKGDRQIIPSCSCPDGFYDDFKNDSCQVCDRLCKTCNIDGCLSCIGNRVLTSEMACEEPPHSVIHTETPWCSTCNVAVIDARFSDDLLSISVKFDFPLNPSFFTSQFQDNICFQILDEQTYLKLGKSPNCFLDHNDSMILIIEVGQQVSIIPGDQIIFYGQYFGHLNCVQKIDIFILNQVKIPINPVSPKIFYDLPTYFLNPCDDNTIPIKSIIFDGLRQLIGIRWTFSVDGQNGNGNLESFVNSLTNLQNLELSIPLQTLPKQSNITFFVEFQNFVQQKSIQLIQVQTHSGQFPTIRWISKPYYYAFETIVLQFQIKKKDCSETTTIPQIDNSQYQVSLVEVYRNESNSRPSRVKYSEITNQNSFNVTIQNYTLTSRVAYVFSQNTFDALLNFSLTRNITLEINAGGIFCQFNGTKKIQNYRKDSNILISCRDLDTQYGWNEDPSISLNITCVDLTMNSLCRDLNKQLIKINKTQSIQTISKQTIPPYTIQSWQVTAQKKQYKYTFKQNIVYLDNDFKLLDITYNKGYIMRSINNYENLKFTIQIPFEDRQYLLEYQVAIIYNFQLIKILKSSYFQYHFRIFDYHTKFDKGKQINLKFLAQFTNEIIPSQEDLQLTVNLPPTCIVQIQSETIVALQPFKIITQCDFSNASPFMYQLRYFINNQDYLDFMDRTSDYSLLLNGYQTSNTFEGFFPFSQAHILIQVIDSRGSYSNIVKQINITQAQFKCSDININKLPYKQQIAMLIEILLNHQQLKYCNSISKQLYSNIKSNLGAEDLNDQFLVYQVVKLYKRFILNEKVTKSNNRLMTMDYQERCFQNSTKSFYIQNSTFNNTLTDTATGLISELQQIKLVSKKLIQKQTQFNSELNQDDIFYDEKLFQKKESVAQSLPILLLMIDDIFVKISTVFIQSDEDSKQIIYIAEELIRLIENIAFQFNDQIEVNGPTFTVNGQILNFQISKQTKDNFNNQFNIDKDLLDGLIDFVQKQQISLNYNYYILQQNISSKLSQFLNTSNLLIEQNFLRKTNLKNHLYDNRFIEYQNIEQKYIVDIAQYQYCQEEVPEQLLNYYYCVEINSFGEYFLCDLQVEEIDNITVSISCKCLQFGDIFLVRYTNNSYEEQTIKQQNLDDKMEDFDLKINEQPILLFHGIFIIFSFFLYIELNCIETKVAYNFINHGIILESTNDDIPTLGKQKLLFYPGSFAIYKMIFKHLHEIISIFYIESFIVTKSFRFLQLSIKISLLIPLSFLEILYIQKVAILAALFVNCVFYLLIRIICKIFQSFYRFRGKLSKFIVGVYLIIHIVCYIFFIILLRKYKGDYHQLNLDISLILTLSIFLQFVILDPVMIFFRIIITKYVTVQIRNIILNPINQLIYFFIENEKLDELLQQYVIM
ncbi:unnamed protein product [Paramecium sonneborni]|uniref:EGF-like domain-containing protein n=1 Tax=Paramecium sonneborni TaxID=65129 RepID=A0A8S1N3X0_9CILI|nr:unnamed protein product [Paramecium sonneborni]